MSIILPLFIAVIFLFAGIKGRDILSSFAEGVRDGLRVSASIFPTLLLSLTAISAFRASGGLEALVFFLEPLTMALNIPKELLPIALLRPLSGSATTAMLDSMLGEVGAESFLGRCAAVIAASTETTFYTFGVYLTGINGRFGRLLAAALSADLAAFFFAVLFVKLLY